MRMFVSFTKKELLESLRTYKLVIMLVVFGMIGIMNPLVAKLIPELLSGTDLQGITLSFPDPTAMDSWAQFFSNIGQMGMLVVVIVFSGIMASEFGKGTLVNILTKGMKRYTVVLSKFVAASAIWTLSYIFCFLITYVYTIMLWETNEMSNAFFSFFCPWLFGLFLIALLIFGGVLFKTFYGSLLLCCGTVAVLLFVSIIPNSERFNPVSLAGSTIAVLNSQYAPEHFVPALVICAVLTLVLVAGSIMIFNKKQV